IHSIPEKKKRDHLGNKVPNGKSMICLLSSGEKLLFGRACRKVGNKKLVGNQSPDHPERRRDQQRPYRIQHPFLSSFLPKFVMALGSAMEKAQEDSHLGPNMKLLNKIYRI